MVYQNKQVLYLLLLLVILLSLPSCGSDRNAGTERNKDEIIASIGNTVINKKSFEEQCRFMALVSGIGLDTLDSDEAEKYRQIMLDHMVENILIKHDLDREGVEVVTPEVEGNAAYFLESVHFNSEVSEQLNDLGISDDTVQNYYITECYIDAFIEKMAMEDKALEAEALQYFENYSEELVEVETKHILVATYEGALEIKRLLENGTEFGKLAKARSLDDTSQSEGYFGAHLLRSLETAYADAVSGMSVNQISDPIKTDKGYYIVQLVAYRNQYEDFDESIKKSLAEHKLDTYIQQLKEKEVIAYNVAG